MNSYNGRRVFTPEQVVTTWTLGVLLVLASLILGEYLPGKWVGPCLVLALSHSASLAWLVSLKRNRVSALVGLNWFDFATIVAIPLAGPILWMRVRSRLTQDSTDKVLVAWQDAHGRIRFLLLIVIALGVAAMAMRLWMSKS